LCNKEGSLAVLVRVVCVWTNPKQKGAAACSDCPLQVLGLRAYCSGPVKF